MNLKDGIDKMMKPQYDPLVKDRLDFFINALWRNDKDFSKSDKAGHETMSLKDYLEYMDDDWETDGYPNIKTKKELWNMEDAYLNEIGLNPKKLTGYESPDELQKLIKGNKK